MNIIKEFLVDSHYSNDQIRYTLNLENLGGIRPSIGKDGMLQHLAIMTTAENVPKRKSENPYRDQIEGNILSYTATGRKGDQFLTGKNKRLLEQYERPLPFYGFSNEGRQTYRFLGLLELLRHYLEQQIDHTGKLRNAWVFEFLIHRQPEIVPIDQASVIAANLIADSRRVGPIIVENERSVVTRLIPDPTQSTQEDISLEQIRSQLLEVNPYKFEYLLQSVFENCGFVNVEVTRSSGDGGIDLNAVVDEMNDFFAGTLVQCQAKRWRHSVGIVEVNNFRGAMSASAKGVFVSTSYYTRAAIEEAHNPTKPSIMLIDGKRLSSIILKTGVEVAKFT